MSTTGTFTGRGRTRSERRSPCRGGSRIDVEAVYDNSPRNGKNPTVPPRDVGWGEGTADEMCIAFIRTTVDSERLGHRPIETVCSPGSRDGRGGPGGGAEAPPGYDAGRGA